MATDQQSSDNYFDPSKQDNEPFTRSMAEVLRVAIDQALRDVNVWLPAQVVSIRNNSFVDVQPCLMEHFRVQGAVQLPILQNIPVEHPRGADYGIKLPIAAGDYGRVIFCDRSLDNWIVAGGVVDPDDSRIHDLSDAVFIPGLYPHSNVISGAATDLIVQNGKAELKVQKAGTFLATNGANELLNLLVQITTQLQQLLTNLSTDTTNTILGPQKLNLFATYQNQANQVQTLLNDLQTLKGS